MMIKTCSFQTLSQYNLDYKKAVTTDTANGLMEYINYTFPYSYHCHEATLSFAYSLNKVIAGKYHALC